MEWLSTWFDLGGREATSSSATGQWWAFDWEAEYRLNNEIWPTKTTQMTGQNRIWPDIMTMHATNTYNYDSVLGYRGLSAYPTKYCNDIAAIYRDSDRVIYHQNFHPGCRCIRVFCVEFHCGVHLLCLCNLQNVPPSCLSWPQLILTHNCYWNWLSGKT